jgi:hypothetical protein
MLALDQEWNYLRTAIEGLHDYLLSDQLYGGLSLPTSGIRTADLSRLTLGSLLLVQARLKPITSYDPRAGENLALLNRQVQDLRHRWQANWDRKALQEIPVRLQSWGKFLDECQEDSGPSGKVYPFRVRERTMLELLIHSLYNHPAEVVSLLEPLDHRLKSFFHWGAFIWEPELANGFPAVSFWFLYGRL